MFNPEFVFETSDTVLPDNQTEASSLPVTGSRLVDSLIAKYRQTNNIENLDDTDLQLHSGITEEDTSAFQTKAITQRKTDRKRKGKVKPEENEKYSFSHAVHKYHQVSSFIDLRLSKPLLKALTELDLDKPMPIQCACIPIALLNHDICACARTGSGKTLAFLLPILERMTKQPTLIGRSFTRALVISPTRELAVQIFKVAEMLVKFFPKLRVQLAAGGLDMHSQEASLRLNPDLVIATPGRLIDHLSNAPAFNLQHVQYLVLDEADKLLDEYFVEQIGEIMKHCGKQRQTLLFSATMTESVKELATLSLKDPVQVFLNQTTAVAQRLQQEFVRVRAHREEDREAMLIALLLRTFRRRTIVFLPTKKGCHRLHILLSLLGLSCAELHGDMTQAQRLDALRRFSEAEHLASSTNETKGKAEQIDGSVPSPPKVDILVATDLAARGLDIPDVQTVINYKLPPTMKQYVHRVGRTARATNSGLAVSLVGEDDRLLLKQIIKEAPFAIQSRVISPDVISHFRSKLEKLEPAVSEILQAELEDRELKAAQIQLEKTEKLMKGDASQLSALANAEASKANRFDWFAERRRQSKFTDRQKGKRRKLARKHAGDSD